jgi:heat shock protein HslJ
MRALRVTAALAIVSALALAACGDDSGSSSASTAAAGSTAASSATTAAAATPAQASAGLAGTSWILSSYNTRTGSSVDAVKAATASLAFTEDKVSGSTGCNDFSGTYTSDEEALTITLGPMTQKACTDPALTAQETAVVAQLANVATYTADAQGLTLKDSTGATVLVYRPGLTGVVGAWTATGVNNGKGAVQTTTLTEQITAVFGPNTLTGSGGCNDYNATYTVSGSDGLTIGPIAATKKLCADAVNAEETAYFTALGNVAKFEISGTTLTLRDSSGATQVTYMRDR